jgi:NifU-like protein involved in Fe-S cluster formation
MDSWTHRGVSGEPGGGRYFIVELVVEDGVIRRAGFESHGCMAARACGSLMTTLVVGRPVETAVRVTAEDLIRILGGVPEGKEYAAALAVEAVRKALGVRC